MSACHSESRSGVAPPGGDDLWFGPNDQWPYHRESSIRDAIGVAREGKWHLKKTLGHGYGRAFCRRVERGAPVCKVIIDSTPKAVEDRAKDLIRAVRDCPHHFADQSADLEYASGLLDGASKLLDAAEDLFEGEMAVANAIEAWDRAQELLDLASGNTDEVERVMEIAHQFEEEARRLTQNGWMRGIEVTGTDGPASSYVIGAEERTDEASGVVAKAPNQEDLLLVTLKVRVSATKGRIADVRLRLGLDGP